MNGNLCVAAGKDGPKCHNSTAVGQTSACVRVIPQHCCSFDGVRLGAQCLEDAFTFRLLHTRQTLGDTGGNPRNCANAVERLRYIETSP